MSKLTATIFAAFLFVSCSNDSVPDLPPPCGGSGYYDIETHYCKLEVREINAGGKNCIITSAAQKGHTYEINCEGRLIGYLDNGKPGEKGENGLNGTNGENCSVANVSLGVEITCATMTLPLYGANGKDGADGKDGTNGEHCTIAQTSEGVEITCSDLTFPLNRGATGATGETGETGATGATGAAGKGCEITETSAEGMKITCDDVAFLKHFATGETGKTGTAGQDCEIEIAEEDGVEIGVKIACAAVTRTLEHGTPGEDGPVITIDWKDGWAYWIIDGENTGIKVTGPDGPPGKDGEGCKVEEKPGAYLVMTCGTGKPVEWPKAMCMLTAYDPAEKFCFENRIAEFCGGKAYNLSNQICHYGKAKSYFTDDRDGKKYAYVEIGGQTWMAQNLNYATGGKCYDDKPVNCDTYGRLYDWETAMKNCPTGWHLPSDAEWDALMTAVGGTSTAGTKLKATSGWNGSGGTDDFGFSALTGGYGYSGGSFYDVGNDGYWWSATEDGSSLAYYRDLDGETVYRGNGDKSNLYSVRCVKGAPLCGGKVYDPATQRCDNGKIKLFDARDGKKYEYVTIGTQTWMAENLNYNAAGSVCYGNDPANCDTYGRLYEWTTAMAGAASSAANPSGVQGVCPSGWHLPSDAEWTALTTFVGGESMAGTKLKATSGWNDNPVNLQSGNGQDTYGFAALPGGSGSNAGGSFNAGGSIGYWWSTTEGGVIVRSRNMGNSDENVSVGYSSKSSLYSVRCLQD